MLRFPIQLAEVTNGSDAWAEFYRGVQSTFANNAAALPVIVAVIGVAVLIWVDFRLAGWLSRRLDRRNTSDKE
ncbi:MAG TPA: hypothetical protein ENJ00_06870 [Phycisphaerales bacterium]|nr:hypothetical protein [Phycisphaerales bacterium]